MRIREFTLVLFFVVLVSSALSQPTELPHRVYGEVTSDSDGSAISDVNVSLRNSSSYIAATQNTSSSGFYDLNIDNMKDGENVYLFLDGSNTSEYLNFSRGSSSELNCRVNGNSCIDTSGGDSDADDEDQDNNNGPDEGTNDNGESNNDDSSGGGGGGSGGGSSSGGGFGGFGQEDSQDQDEESKDRNISLNVRLDSGGDASLLVNNISKSDNVRIDVEGNSTLRGVSFVSDQNSTSAQLSLNSSVNPAFSVPENFTVIENVELESDGLSPERSFLTGFELDKLSVQDRDVSAGEVMLIESSQGERVDLSLASGINRYFYEAELEDLNGEYSIGYSKEIENKPTVSIRSVTSEVDGSSANVSIEVVNPNSGVVKDSVELMVNGRSLETWSVSLDSGESRELRYSDSFDTGEYSFSVREEFVEVQISAEEDGELPILVILGSLIAVVVLVLNVVVLKGYRSASEVEETIERIEEVGGTVNSEAGNVRRDIEELRRYIKNS